MWRFFQNHNRKFLVVLSIVHVLLWIYAVIQIKTYGHEAFTYFLPLAFCLLTGSFIIGDLIAFSALGFVLSVFLAYVNDLRYSLVSVLIFAVLRSLGETIYWFNYQFSAIRPHDFSNPFVFLGNLPEKDIFILYQTSDQVLLVIFSILLFVLIKNWERIGKLIK